MTMVNVSDIQFHNGRMDFNLCWIIGNVGEEIADTFDRENECFFSYYAESTGHDIPDDWYEEFNHDSAGLLKESVTPIMDAMCDSYGDLFTVHDRHDMRAGMDGEWRGAVTNLFADSDGCSFSHDHFSSPDYIPARMTVDADRLRNALNNAGITELDDGRTPGSGFYRTLAEPEWYVVQALTALMAHDYSAADRFFYQRLEILAEEAEYGGHMSYGKYGVELWEAANNA